MAMITREAKGAPLTFDELDGNFGACMGVHNLLHVQERQINGTHAGTFTNGAWRTRDLNYVVVNNITGSSLSVKQITLPVGTYYAYGKSCAVNVEANAVRLYKTGSSQATLLDGMNDFCTGAITRPEVSGIFTLSEQAVIELQHYCWTTVADFGLGVALSVASRLSELYADLKIWKLS